MADENKKDIQKNTVIASTANNSSTVHIVEQGKMEKCIMCRGTGTISGFSDGRISIGDCSDCHGRGKIWYKTTK